MAKGIYQRYESAETTRNIFVFSGFIYSNTSSLMYYKYYSTYYFDKYKGLYLKESDKTVSPAENTFYRPSGTGIQMIQYAGMPSVHGAVQYNFYDGNATSSTETIYSRGTYLTDIIADYGALPTNGRHTDGYWYVFVKTASDVKVNVGGIMRDVPTGFVNVNGIMRPQNELKANVDGIWR